VQRLVVNIFVFLVGHRFGMPAYRIVGPARNQNWEFCQGSCGGG
jgi:hypothetical protein